jgi:hypothetical protein
VVDVESLVPEAMSVLKFLAQGPRLLLDRLDHLSEQPQDLKDGMQKAVLVPDLDPEMALARARKVLEYVVRLRRRITRLDIAARVSGV